MGNFTYKEIEEFMEKHTPHQVAKMYLEAQRDKKLLQEMLLEIEKCFSNKKDSL